MSHLPTRKRIGLILFPGVTALDLVGPAEAFANARAPQTAGAAHALYEVVLVGITRNAVVSESGVRLLPHCALDQCPQLDTVIVPGGGGLRKTAINQAVAAWLLKRSHAIRRIASVCTGIYGLAPTGLLDGRRVTTHWAFAADVARRYPKLRVLADAIYLRDGRFFTSAGITAGIDLSLALIEADHGRQVSLAVARELVIYMRRSGGQEQYSEPLRFQAASHDRFADLFAWIDANLHRSLAVEDLARHVHLGARHFSRHFKKVCGQTPARYLERQRLDLARLRLADTPRSVAAIANSVGFTHADSFSRAFERAFGLAPRDYRARFRSRP